MIQIESFLLHAQLRRFMMKGQKMLHYPHFQELMVTYSKLKPYIGIFFYCPITALLDQSNNFNFLAATIFAYGQTSSGKTFTMRGITENAIQDIYECIKNVSD